MNQESCVSGSWLGGITLSQDKKQYLIDWINNKRVILEDAFFYFEGKDSMFTEEILDALYILESVPITY